MKEVAEVVKDSHKFASVERNNKLLSRVDKLGLGDMIRELKTKGLSNLSIARKINEMPEMQSEPIKAREVQNWSSKNIVEDFDVDKKDEILNLYNENKRLLDSVEQHIETIDIFREHLTSKIEQSGDVEGLYDELMKLYKDTDRFYARKQLILQQMGLLQDKVYNLQTLSDIVQEVLAIVQRKDESMYQEIIEEMKSNRILLSAYEKVQDFKRGL